MSAWLYSVILTAAVCIAVYLLYYMGFGVAKRIAAVMFVFRPGKNAEGSVGFLHWMGQACGEIS